MSDGFYTGPPCPGSSYYKFAKQPNVKKSADFMRENIADCFMGFFLGDEKL